jgi:anti-sigma factor RsiW
MQHLDEGTIHSWLDGALTADEAARVEAHVKECPQCAAAVAEARGFIAASSRILTSLDNVPKGVVPIAQRPKVRNWPVWRAAAAVLVVALGSFVVLRDRVAAPERTSSVDTIASNRAKTTRMSTTPAAGATAQTAAAASPRNATPIRVPEAPRAVSERAQRATDVGGNQGNVLQPVSPTTAVPQPETRTTPATQFRKAAQASANSREDIRDNVAAPAGVAASGAAAPGRSVLSGQTIGAVAMRDANEPQLVRIVGRPRVIGQIQTLYEVAPGDTVLLAEVSNARLESIVVMGASATAVRQDTSLSGESVLRAQAKAPAGQDNARKTGSPPSAPVVAPVAPSVQTSNGITTLSWSDPATRSTVKLSGRHSLVELLDIKRRIEQFRAAEAAKKKP